MADIASSSVARQNSNWSYPSPHGKEQRVNQNRNIQKETAVSNVVEVVLNVLVDQECSVGAQLPQTGDPGSDLESLPLLGGIVLHDEGHLRPGSDKGHISQKDIYQLRQFIQAALPMVLFIVESECER